MSLWRKMFIQRGTLPNVTFEKNILVDWWLEMGYKSDVKLLI